MSKRVYLYPHTWIGGPNNLWHCTVCHEIDSDPCGCICHRDRVHWERRDTWACVIAVGLWICVGFLAAAHSQWSVPVFFLAFVSLCQSPVMREIIANRRTP